MPLSPPPAAAPSPRGFLLPDSLRFAASSSVPRFVPPSISDSSASILPSPRRASSTPLRSEEAFTQLLQEISEREMRGLRGSGTEEGKLCYSRNLFPLSLSSFSPCPLATSSLLSSHSDSLPLEISDVGLCNFHHFRLFCSRRRSQLSRLQILRHNLMRRSNRQWRDVGFYRCTLSFTSLPKPHGMVCKKRTIFPTIAAADSSSQNCLDSLHGRQRLHRRVFRDRLQRGTLHGSSLGRGSATRPLALLLLLLGLGRDPGDRRVVLHDRASPRRQFGRCLHANNPAFRNLRIR